MSGATPDANNPFIGNPFMKGGMDGVKPQPAAPPSSRPAPPPLSRSAQPAPSSRTGSRLPNTVKGPIARDSSSDSSQTSDRTRRPTSPAPPEPSHSRRTRQRPFAEPAADALDRPATSKATRSANGKAAKSAAQSASPSSSSSASEPTGKTKRSTTKGKRQPQKSKRSPAAEPPSYAAPAPSGGYKVQVIAKIPVSNNTNLPGRDYLWFADYPIIPRVGDCLFQNGMYFRVDAVFLYENNRPGWCADVEVSYYARRR